MKKWNKKICLEYVEQMRSPIEEAGQNGQKLGLSQIAEKLRQRIMGSKEVPKEL